MKRLAIALLLAAAAQVHADPAPAAPTPFEQGLVRFRAADYRAAVAPLEQARAAEPDDADIALLLGISYYQTGRSDDARPLLAQAERDGDADAKASARVFLGLLADAAGKPDLARSYYTLVAHSPSELGATGRLLLEQNGPERWSVVAIVRPGFDSNVPVLPDTMGGPGRGGGGGGGDADLTLIGSLTARPVQDVPLVLDETASYRKQASLGAYDMLADLVGATASLADRCNRASLAYHFDVSTLGGARYELAHLAEGSYHRHLGGDFALGLRYAFAARDYAVDAYAGYSGLTHTAIAEAVWGSPGGPQELALGYVFSRESTDDPALSAIAHGGRAVARTRVAKGAELRATVLVSERFYDAASMGRRDLFLRGEGALYIDLSGTLGLVLGTTVLRNGSNTGGDSYSKLAAFAGLVIGAAS